MLPGAVLTPQLAVHVVRVRRAHVPSPHSLQGAPVARTTETVGIAEAPLEEVLVDIALQQELLEAASFGVRKQTGHQSPLLLELLLGHQPQDV